MSQTVNVNGVSINYPETGDTGWGDEGTAFAVQTSSALSKLGLSTGTTVDLPGTLDVTGVTTLDSNLSVGGNSTLTGNLTVNGNTILGNATSDTVSIAGNVSVDTNVLLVDVTNNRVGINKTSPTVDLDVVGNVAISGNNTVGGTLGVTGNTTLSGTLGVTGDVAVNTNKFNVIASSGNTTIAGTLGITGNTTLTGQLLNSDGTASLPGISFSSDTNTGIFRSASDQIDIITGGSSRFRIESTGQIKGVYESQVGTDYNTTLGNGYLIRAWVKFTGAGSTTVEASGNVTSVTYNSTGDYTINFTTALPDANYGYSAASKQNGAGLGSINYPSSVAVGSLRIVFVNTDTSPGARDQSFISVVVFR